MTGLKDQQDHPLAPNRPLAPITWKQAPAEPHGYYDRVNYARGWNDAVSVAQAKFGEPIYQAYLPLYGVEEGNVYEWKDVTKDAYDLMGREERRIIHIIGE